MKMTSWRVRQNVPVTNGWLERSVDILAALTGLAFVSLADAMHTSARVDVVVYGPVRALATVREGSRHLLEAWVERKVMTDGILRRRTQSQ